MFIAQFLTRIRKRRSAISLTKTPANIRAITEVVRKLAMGEEPAATSADENVELVLPIEVNGKHLDLVCPDYGGEQMNDVTEFMEVADNWVELLKSSDRWVLFIRPISIVHDYDLSISSYEEISNEKSGTAINPGLSEQSKFIELLQSLLHVKGVGVRRKVTTPTLLIVLTCWDELGETERPVEVLRDKLPMLLHFAETVWDKKNIAILGLSSQEFPLNNSKAKERYQDELPENFGYMVDQLGNKDKDLTKVVETALQL